MIQQERELRIYDLLQTYRVMRVEQLAAELKVTPATVRNDLTRMMRNGLVKRVHGGAILAKDPSTAYEIPFSLRRDAFQEEKQLIGRVAAGEVSDGQTIILDVSTTVLEAARNLRMRKNLIVITNAIHIFMELCNCPEMLVILTGGMLERDEMCLVGPIAENTLRGFYADKAIIGVGGLSLGKGITGFGIAESEVPKVMIESAREIVVVADSSKLDRVSFTATAPLEKIHRLITDWHAQPGQIKALKDRGLEVVVCGPNTHQESTGRAVPTSGN